MSTATLSVHDPDFKNLVSIPLQFVKHLPPAHMEISRLVLCRKYNAQAGEDSCPMGASCKFVHADLAASGIETQSIHVNYAWRSVEEIKFERLPPGEMLQVMAPNNRAPVQLLPSELILATHGALTRHQHHGPLSHCAHYYFNRMCNRGDRCNFIHAAHVDPTASEFQRAPPRSGGGYFNMPSVRPAVSGFVSHTSASKGLIASPRLSDRSAASTPVQNLQRSYAADTESSCDLSASEVSSEVCSDDCECSCKPQHQPQPVFQSAGVVYRRNPYSLLEVTIAIERPYNF